MKCWRKRKAVSPVRMGKFCWTLFPFLASEGRIGQHHVVAVFFLNVREVLGQGVRVDDVRRFDAMQYHIHDGDDVSERLLFLAVERAVLERGEILGGQSAFGLQVIERFA